MTLKSRELLERVVPHLTLPAWGGKRSKKGGSLVINDPKISNWHCPANPIMDMLPSMTVECSTIIYTADSTVGSNFQDAPTANMTYNGAGVVSNEGSITVSYLPPPTPWVNCTTFMTRNSCEQAGCNYDIKTERCIPKP